MANTDYKILAKCLVDRWKQVLPSIINNDQTGFVKGRVINSNIQRALNLFDHCKEKNINGLMVNIDFEKAFDSAEWHLIYKALKYSGFPHKFIKWIKVFYTDIETGVINNGHLAKLFKPE